MSDLIERLQDVWDGKATFPTERLPEIIEQLKTVRGIERLASEKGDQVRIEKMSSGYAVTVITRSVYRIFEGTTLAAAVEAAGKKGEG